MPILRDYMGTGIGRGYLVIMWCLCWGLCKDRFAGKPPYLCADCSSFRVYTWIQDLIVVSSRLQGP